MIKKIIYTSGTGTGKAENNFLVKHSGRLKEQ
jgi:hypothetical protein